LREVVSDIDFASDFVSCFGRRIGDCLAHAAAVPVDANFHAFFVMLYVSS
jgi:hypothetical protein